MLNNPLYLVDDVNRNLPDDDIQFEFDALDHIQVSLCLIKICHYTVQCVHR